MEIKIKSLDNIREAAKAFLDGMGTGKVFAFYGKMGAGKTTFIKAQSHLSFRLLPNQET